MKISRRKLIVGGAALAGVAGVSGYVITRPKPVALGFDVDLDLLQKAKNLIAQVPSFDLHAHPGRTFVKQAKNLKGVMKLYAAKGTFEDKAVADMQTGGMNAVAFMTVSDFQILAPVKEKGLVAHRDFYDGEAWTSYKTQVRNLKALSERNLVTQVFNTTDILKARKNGKTAALFGSEGGDFLGGSRERLREAYQDGIRIINPMHYHHNELGDIMTETPRHNGLTISGEMIIKEMNALGIVIDGAHASEASLSDILDISEHPILCSHTHILKSGQIMPRFISKNMAQRIADSGGVIGAWPSGLGISTMDGFITRIAELVDIVGIDHVGIGTDMDANYKPVWDNYADFPLIVMRMMQRGFSNEEIIKIIGANGLRVLSTVTEKTE